MKRVLVAGATGHLGRHVVGELRRRGHWTRALVRGGGDPARLERVKGEADEVFEGDLSAPSTLRGACEGLDVVFSAASAPLGLGLSDARATFSKIDYAGNRNLLEEAISAGVRGFVYVSVFGAENFKGLEYVEAHERFVRELGRSGVRHTVIRPTGFFSAMGEVLKMARRGPLMSIGSGEARTNPIHEEDLAVVCADAVEAVGAPAEVEAGGPEIFTRREITEMAFAALGKEPKTFRVPAPLLKLMLLPLLPVSPRLYALMSFFVAVAQVDAVAPRHGARSLRDYFREQAKNTPT